MEVNQDGEQCTGMKHDVKGKTEVLPPEQPGHNDQVCRTADGQKLSESL
jgi:hypothetical protein